MNHFFQASRREFLKTSATAASVVLAGAPVILAQAEKRVFKVALIGCGGRGSGAIRDHIEAAKVLNEKLGMNIEIQVVATADWSKNRAKSAGEPFGVPAERCFGGPGGYKKVLEANPDIVLMAQPPAFKPLHFDAAIKAGKHVFFEKPVAVDPPGVRTVVTAGELAKQKNLCVVAGTQRRHEQGYNDRARAIKDGAYGRIMGGRVSWCMGGIFGNTPINPNGPEDLVGGGRWQLWIEMSGDHIVEQHVHNIDIANWFLDAHPVSAVGFGHRAKRVAGNMYDFFSIDFEYPNNIHIHSMCRQVAGCKDWVGEDFTYEKSKPKDFKPQTPDPYEAVGYPKSGYTNEHMHLLYAIIKGQPLNEARNVAWSTGAAILGRESAYSGLQISWKDMFDDPAGKFYNLTLRPSAEDFEKGELTVFPKDGDIRIPGLYKPA